MTQKYWNIVDLADPEKFLMPVSTVNYVIASNRADELRRQFPLRRYAAVKTDILEPYKEVGRNECERGQGDHGPLG